MQFKLSIVLVSILLLNTLIGVTNGNNRYRRVLDAVRILFNGQTDSDDLDDKSDIYINTRVGLLDLLAAHATATTESETMYDVLTVDEILRILIQNVVIVTAQNRYDLVKPDFFDRHKEMDNALLKMNDLLDRLAKNGTASVTLADLRPLTQLITTDGFWNGFNDLYNEVKERRDLEKVQATTTPTPEPEIVITESDEL